MASQQLAAFSHLPSAAVLLCSLADVQLEVQALC